MVSFVIRDFSSDWRSLGYLPASILYSATAIYDIVDGQQFNRER